MNEIIDYPATHQIFESNNDRESLRAKLTARWLAEPSLSKIPERSTSAPPQISVQQQHQLYSQLESEKSSNMSLLERIQQDFPRTPSPALPRAELSRGEPRAEALQDSGPIDLETLLSHTQVSPKAQPRPNKPSGPVVSRSEYRRSSSRSTTPQPRTSPLTVAVTSPAAPVAPPSMDSGSSSMLNSESIPAESVARARLQAFPPSVDLHVQSALAHAPRSLPPAPDALSPVAAASLPPGTSAPPHHPSLGQQHHAPPQRSPQRLGHQQSQQLSPLHLGHQQLSPQHVPHAPHAQISRNGTVYRPSLESPPGVVAHRLREDPSVDLQQRMRTLNIADVPKPPPPISMQMPNDTSHLNSPRGTHTPPVSQLSGFSFPSPTSNHQQHMGFSALHPSPVFPPYQAVNPMMAVMGYGQQQKEASAAQGPAPSTPSTPGVPPQFFDYQQYITPPGSSYRSPQYWDTPQFGSLSSLASTSAPSPFPAPQISATPPAGRAVGRAPEPRRFQHPMGGSLTTVEPSPTGVVGELAGAVPAAVQNGSDLRARHLGGPVPLPMRSDHGAQGPIGVAGLSTPGLGAPMIPLAMDMVGAGVQSPHSQAGAAPTTASARSLLSELKLNSKHSTLTLMDVVQQNLVVELATDQNGSRFIQQRLEAASNDEKQAVFEQILPDTLRLCTDVFGNYVIQKLFEFGLLEHRHMLGQRLLGNVLPLTLQMYGCRVIQKALEAVNEDMQAALVRELSDHVMQCVKDQNGNHVVQKCIEKVPPQHIHFIVRAFAAQVHELSMHPYGCRVIQRLLEHCTDEQKLPILNEIAAHGLDLVRDQYGNYVVQHVLQRGSTHFRTAIIRAVCGNVLLLSKHKFASNVVECCFLHGSPDEKAQLVEEVIGTGDTSPLSAMVRDQYANYVVQRILGVVTEQQRARIIRRIVQCVPNIRKIAYGKHIVARVEKLTGKVL